MINMKELQKGMDGLGYQERYNGTGYLRDAVVYVDANPDARMKEVYPAIARQHNTRPNAVERAIRTATENAKMSPMWEKGYRDMGGWNHPTNAEMVFRLAREFGGR